MYSTCHQACWLVTPEKGVISEDQRQSLSLADQHWALSSSCSQASLGKWKSMWSHPHITSIRAAMALCSWAHWAWQGRLEKGYPQNRTVHPIVFITEHLYWLVTFWCACTWDTSIVTSLAIQRDQFTYFFPKCLPNFLIKFVPTPWLSHQTTGYNQRIIPILYLISDHFSFKAKLQPSVLLSQVLLTERIVFHWCLVELP